MMPTVRYCSTPAGRVAYSTVGSGPPLLCETGWVSHLRGQLELFAFGSFIERLAERFTVIRYDKPGCGLSDRDSVDLSFDGQVATALAVADAVRADRFCLFGASQGGQIAAAVAARSPDRVEALVLYGMCASGADLAPPEVRDSIVSLIRANWGLGLKMMTGIFIPDPSPDDIDAMARFQRESASAAVGSRLLKVYYETDIRELLPAIRARTAILHREGDRATGFKLGQEVASLVPGAALFSLPGSSHLFYHGDWAGVLGTMLGFLGEPAGSRVLLTDRELEVAGLVAEGLTNHSIAMRLSIAPRTAAADAGIDYVCCGDHVSFFGIGSDGLVQATALAMLHPTLPIHIGVYLLPLRHPVLVARQLADFARLAPGRLVFGVGVGGEDRHEVSMCGVDPATRGERMNECLAILRQLLAGTAVSFHGAFFDLDDAVIAPASAAPIPIIIGGRSDVAIRRAGRLGDGWLGIWNSPARFAAATQLAADEAARSGRDDPPTRHAMQVWCGLADSRETALACIAPAMQAYYQLPFERFERYCPYGTADDVAEFLTPYADAGCTEFNLIPQSPDHDQAIAGVAAVKKLLART